MTSDLDQEVGNVKLGLSETTHTLSQNIHKRKKTAHTHKFIHKFCGYKYYCFY